MRSTLLTVFCLDRTSLNLDVVSEEGHPVSGKVLVVIVAVDSSTYFICDEMKTLGYFDHFHAYNGISGKLVAENSTALKDHHPLSVHTVVSGVRELCLIAPRHKIVGRYV